MKKEVYMGINMFFDVFETFANINVSVFWDNSENIVIKEIRFNSHVFSDSEKKKIHDDNLFKILNDIFINNCFNPEIINYLDLSKLSTFSKKVLITLAKKVPKGKVISYSKLAKICGFDKASRAAGTVLANNPYPLIFPCHRVILKNGQIGCFRGSMKDNKLKYMLLKSEQIKFKQNNTIYQNQMI